MYVWPHSLKVNGPSQPGKASATYKKQSSSVLNTIAPIALFSPDDLQGFDVIIETGDELSFAVGAGFTIEFPPEK